MTDFVKGELAGVAAFVVVIAFALACGHLLGRGDPVVAAPTVPDAGPCAPCPSTVALTQDLSACEARAEVLETSPPERRVVVQGAAKRCGGEGPVIAPVATTECASGMTCLDASAQRALVKNLAAYEAWVRKVQECEAR